MEALKLGKSVEQATVYGFPSTLLQIAQDLITWHTSCIPFSIQYCSLKAVKVSTVKSLLVHILNNELKNLPLKLAITT